MGVLSSDGRGHLRVSPMSLWTPALAPDVSEESMPKPFKRNTFKQRHADYWSACRLWRKYLFLLD
jgi:hypothetical protein